MESSAVSSAESPDLAAPSSPSPFPDNAHVNVPPVSPVAAPSPSPLRLQTSLNAHPDLALNPRHASTLANSPFVSPIMAHARTDSNFSDHMSTYSTATATTSQPTPVTAAAASSQRVHPPPAYVAASNAVQVISEHRVSAENPVSSDDDAETNPDAPPRDDLQFAEPALALVNAFLDQLLYSILSSARSTTLTALRPAVVHVLKQRLGQAAIASADEELRELLAGPEEEEDEPSARPWDLELVWKRTRLRVMVYIRLGEMEDDDEERYIKEDELIHSGTDDRRFSQSAGLVSWASAIFLTSVLEYVAEQTLQIGGQAAYARTRRQNRTVRRVAASASHQSEAPSYSQAIVEEHDVEKVALNPALGRLWRTWRKSLRGSSVLPLSSHQRSFSQASTDTNMSSAFNRRSAENTLPSTIPLPIGEESRDVAEIEVPGLARDPDETPDVTSIAPAPRRRSSFNMPYPKRQDADGIATPNDNYSSSTERWRPVVARKRSNSVPLQKLYQNQDQMPGSFPGGDNQANDVPAWPEQKADAREMMAARNQQQASRDQSISTQQQDHDDGNVENRGLIGGAIAGASAAAAGAAALVYSSKNANSEESAEHENAAAVSPRTAELDRRKSLVGMKALSNAQQVADPTTTNATDSSQILLSRKVSVTHPPAAPTLVRTGSQSSQHLLSGDDDKKTTARSLSQNRGSSDPNSKTAEELAVNSALAASTLDYVLPAQSSGPQGKRASVPGIALTGSGGGASPVVGRGSGKQQNRQSWSFAGRPLSTIGALPSSKFSTLVQPPVEEAQPRRSTGDDAPEVLPHPIAIQRDASLNGDNKAATVNTLTSASIRGPEDFDMFVQGGETVKYTLTPAAVREEISQAQAQAASMPGDDPVELPDALARASSYNNALENSTLPGNKSMSNDTADAYPVVAEDTARRPSRPTTRNSGSVRSGLMARDARVQTESTRDFADFIRSTGPQRAARPQPILSGNSRSATNLHSLRNAHINGSRADSLERSKSVGGNGSDVDDQNAPPVPPVPATARKLEPRAPTVPSSSTANAELIDFIRNGPVPPAGEHRIARTVAPFRTTMDSDQMGEWGDRINGNPQMDLSLNGAANTKSSRAERNVRGPPPVAPPPNRSVNANGLPNRVSSLAASNDDSSRKRYRNKDPYPIDLTDDEDDEDDDLLTALPKNRRQEVSLMEFLNNTEPPTDNAPRPIVNNPGAVAPLLRTIGSSEMQNGASSGQNTLDGATEERNVSDTSAGSKGLTLDATEIDAPVLQKPVGQLVEASPKPPATAPASTGMAPKTKMEARMPGFAHERHKAAAEQSATTRELADFLKSTAPSNEGSAAPAPIIAQGPRPSSSPQKSQGSRQVLTKKVPSSGESFVSKNSTSRGKLGSFFGLRKWKSQALVETSRS